MKPSIWRRLLLPDNYTLGELHDAIQIAMGWYDCHMHDFRIGSLRYSSLQSSEEEDTDIPEDCGGVPGYFAILEALHATKKTEEQKELLEWLEDKYDPERFNLNAVNRQLKRKFRQD